MGLFGLNFGAKKTSSSSKSELTKNETTNQSQTTNTTGTTNTATQSNTANQSQGTAVSSQTGATTATKATDTTGVSSLFSGDVQGGLEGLVTNLLGTAGTANPATAGLNFDASKYVAGAVDAAKSTTQGTLDTTLGGIADMVGAKLGNSSMGDLLAARATNDRASALAGVESQAQGTAAQIQNAQANTQLAGQSTSNNILTQLLSVLKGGQAVTSQSGVESGTGTSTGTNTTNTSESSTSATSATQSQTIQQLVDALLSGTTNTKGTESTKGSGTEFSGGLKIG